MVAVVLVVVIVLAAGAYFTDATNRNRAMLAKADSADRVSSLAGLHELVTRDLKLIFGTKLDDTIARRLPPNWTATVIREASDDGANHLPAGTLQLTYSNQTDRAHLFAMVNLKSFLEISPTDTDSSPLKFKNRASFTITESYTTDQGTANQSVAGLVRTAIISDHTATTNGPGGLANFPVPTDQTLGTKDVVVTGACPVDEVDRASYLSRLKVKHTTPICTDAAVAMIKDSQIRVRSGSIAVPTQSAQLSYEQAQTRLQRALAEYNSAVSVEASWKAAGSRPCPIEVSDEPVAGIEDAPIKPLTGIVDPGASIKTMGDSGQTLQLSPLELE